MHTSLGTLVNGLRTIEVPPVTQPLPAQGLTQKPGPIEELTSALERVGKTHQQFFRDIEKGSRSPDPKETLRERSSAFYAALAASFGIELSSSGFIYHRERGVISCNVQDDNAKNSYRVNFRKEDERYIFDSLEVTRKPTPKAPALTLEDLAKELCKQDSSHPRVSELMSDPSLKALPLIYRRILTLEAEGAIPVTKTQRDRTEHSSWIARNLYAAGTEPSEQTILAASKEIAELQKAHRNTTLFQGRTGVLLAHQETLADVVLTDETSKKDRHLSAEELSSYRRGVGDDRMFGRDAVVQGIRQQIGDEKALTVIRAEDKLSFGLLKLTKTHHDTLKRWHIPDGEKNAPTVAEVSALKSDLRRILALPAEEAITLAYQSGVPGSGASFEVRRKDEVLLRSSLLVGEDGMHKDISLTQAPKKLPFSPKDAKEAALRAIATTAAGKEGFVFVFEGHGSGTHLYLSEGSPRPGGFFEKPQTVRVSAAELAEALNAREKRPESSKPDVVILKCCFGVEFARGVTDHIRRLGGTPPIFICQSEYGQYGYSALNRPLSPFQRALFPATPTPRTIGDLIPVFGEHGNFDSNPTILVPGSGKGYRQISSLPQLPMENPQSERLKLHLPPAQRGHS